MNHSFTPTKLLKKSKSIGSSKSHTNMLIRFWQPRIKDVLINSIGQLCAIIKKDYPSLKRHIEFPKQLVDAKLHFALIQHVRRKSYLQRGEITCLAKQNNCTVQKAAAYLRDAWRPRLYYTIERSLPKSEAERRIAKILKKNHGICSTEDVVRRLNSYYPLNELIQTPSYEFNLSQVRKYFEALELLTDGGIITEIAKTLKTSPRTITRWYYFVQPSLFVLACHIPEEDPGVGYKWLPTKMESGRSYKPLDFIRVPFSSINWLKIADMLKSIQTLNNTNMQRWQQQFGKISKEEAFGYVLGMLLSDSGKAHKTTTSIKATLQLSKVYQWSKQVGEAFCYYLGKIGIKAQRGRPRQPNTHLWKSVHSPILKWMVFSGLGLKRHERTSYDTIRADWLFTAPFKVRLKFLQGVTDGDGCALIGKQILSIASGVNSHFIKKLLETFDVESRCISSGRRARVDVSRKKSVKIATELPFFLHAIGRQAAADKSLEMIKAREKIYRQPVPKDIIDHMIGLREQGLSFYKITERIFDEYGLSYRRWRIRSIIKRNLKKE